MSAASDPSDSPQSIGAPRASVDTRLSSDASDSTDAQSEPKGGSPGDSTPTISMQMDNRGQTENLAGVILGIGIAVVVGFVVLFLANEVMAMTNVSAGGPNTSADPLYPAYDALQTATNNTFEMFGLLFIIALLSVAIIYLWRAQGQR